jgi:cytochrome c-type biogenesis protein CcsB
MLSLKALELGAPFCVFLLALLAFMASYIMQKPLLASIGSWGLLAGWLAQTITLGLRWAQAGRPPMSNMFESMVTLAWGLMPLYYLARRNLKLAGLDAWAAGAVLALLGAANLFEPAIKPLMPALQSYWLLYHVVVIMLAYAGLTLSAVGALVFLLRCQGREEGALAAGVESFTYRSTALGFLLLTAGIFLGAVWANEAWGSYWSWDPKETWSLITWLVYAIALHLRRSWDWRGRRFSWLSLAGFAFMLFTYVGVNYLVKGLHSYARS